MERERTMSVEDAFRAMERATDTILALDISDINTAMYACRDVRIL
jgi:hypothetical protein